MTTDQQCNENEYKHHRESPVVAAYVAILGITDHMRRAAEKGDWEVVLAHGDKYHESVQNLRDVSADASPSEEDRKVLTNVVRSILHNDGATRDLIHPEMARIQEYLKMGRRQKVGTIQYGLIAGVLTEV